MQEVKLIVGLGNPGCEYKNTRHNVGFMAVDFLAGDDAKWKSDKKSLISKQGNIIYAKPQTFMNLSGESVLALMTYYKIPIENLVVIHDDIDLKIGTFRAKVGGGSGGHNGIKSIDSKIGNNYKRIRIGVGHSRDNCPEMDVSDWVLGKLSGKENLTLTDSMNIIKTFLN